MSVTYMRAGFEPWDVGWLRLGCGAKSRIARTGTKYFSVVIAGIKSVRALENATSNSLNAARIHRI
jgi:hypothetical protein